MIRKLTDAADCRAAWDALSPGQKAWDDWDLMFAFHDQDNYDFNFLVKESGGTMLGLPENTVFFDLNGPWVEALLQQHPQYTPNFSERDNRYYLVPEEFDYDFNNHIAKFSSEKRKGFLYDLRKIREKGPVLAWSEDDESELFIDLCNRRFGEDSDYVKEGGKAELRRVIRELKHSGCLKTQAAQRRDHPGSLPPACE